MLINNNINTSADNLKDATGKYHKSNIFEKDIYDEHVIGTSSTFLDEDDMQLDPTAINLNVSVDNINGSNIVDSVGESDGNTDPTATININKRKFGNTLSSLNSDILLSSKGLPYIVENAQKRIKISSKKSNYDNLSNIIEFYQIWAHQCFPKFRFRDFINNCERIGKVDRDIKDYRLNLFLKEANIKIGMDQDETNIEVHTEKKDAVSNIAESNGEETNIASNSVIRNEGNKSSNTSQNFTNGSGSSSPQTEPSSNIIKTNISTTNKNNDNENPDYLQREQSSSGTYFTHSVSTVSQEDNNNINVTSDGATVAATDATTTAMNNDINNNNSNNISIQNLDEQQSDGSNNEDDLALMRELDI
ncbi:uncharacterized protein SCODWIG_02444 [Saccharomycodes ludwigii]|uniref:Chromosome segregation in meiosis protein n=1 Tax=Saccharomycodes ludwigii TaxID=36035 RepID=A0A376B7M2_9ASCO|nr:uncharacterized protein SCODWIG_02444 [Saccharomycodes ludwigii]